MILFFLLIIILIIYYLTMFKNNELFTSSTSDMSSITNLLVNYICKNPKKIKIDGKELTYSLENHKKAMDFCIKNNYTAFMVKDNVFAWSNNILKINPNSPMKYKSWVINSSILESDIIVKNKNIGINNEPNILHYLDVNGSMVIETDDNNKENICLSDDDGVECLTRNDIYNINKAPIVFQPNEVLCLKDNKGVPVCINENELGILTGTSKFKLRNISTTDYNANNYISTGKVDLKGGEATLSTYVNTPTELQECAGDYGKRVGDPVCCEKEGTIDSAEYICKNPKYPKCSGYISDKAWGRCISKSHIYINYKTGNPVDVYNFQEGADNKNVHDFFISLPKPSSLDNTLPVLKYNYTY
jgi:hypothetical protein